jgi:hypothetical protein
VAEAEEIPQMTLKDIGTLWLYFAVGTPILLTVIEVVNGRMKPGIMEWIRRTIPETKPWGAVKLLLSLLFLWPFVLLVMGVAARKGQSALEYIAHHYEDKAKMEAQVEAQKREKEARILPAVVRLRRVLWTGLNIPLAEGGTGTARCDVQMIGIPGDPELSKWSAVTHTVAFDDGGFLLWRVTNNFDAEKDTPYARFPTLEEAHACGSADTEWIERRTRDLVQVMVGLAPNKVRFRAVLTVPDPAPPTS